MKHLVPGPRLPAFTAEISFTNQRSSNMEEIIQI